MNYATFDPDELKGHADDARSTIFIDRVLYVDSVQGRSHRSLYNRGKGKAVDRLRARLGPELRPDSGYDDGRGDGWFELYNKYLFGRVGSIVNQASGQTIRLASFWGRGADYKNPNALGPVDQIPACIQKLYYRKLVDNGTIVVWGDGRVCTAGEILNQQLQPQAI